MKELDLIQKFEPIFIKAGKMAKRLQKNATSIQKLETGVKEIDIVTSADLAIQEFILENLAKSDLKNCELIAEEKTPSVKLFAKSSKFAITVDPIDGTHNYATGKDFYSVLITLHNKIRPIYTFSYYPIFGWTMRIVEDKCQFSGPKPVYKTNKIPPKTIIYAVYSNPRDPKITFPKEFKKMTGQGYHFIERRKISTEAGSTLPFVLGLVDGYFTENGSAYDCLESLHFALANKYKVINTLDLSRTFASPSGAGELYKGAYLVYR